MRSLEHPFKREVEALRRLVLSAHPSIAEGVKWNAPSFRTTEYFATTHLRAKVGIGLILHLGAKVKTDGKSRMLIEDSDRLLTWLGKDRASVTFSDMKDLKSKASALKGILGQWVTYV